MEVAICRVNFGTANRSGYRYIAKKYSKQNYTHTTCQTSPLRYHRAIMDARTLPARPVPWNYVQRETDMPTMLHDLPPMHANADNALAKMRQVFGFAKFREG